MTQLTIEPVQLLVLLIKAGLLFAALLVVIFTWVGMRRVQLLNRMVHTPLDRVLSLSAFLFFLLSIVALIIMTLLWITPFF